METAIKINTEWNATTNPKIQSLSIYGKWLALEDTQAKNKTLWYLVSMMTQGILFLPIPAYLIYYYHAPVFIVAITMVLFFSNIIAGMGGYGIRVLISIFSISILAHIIMFGLYVL
jgi:hypothetical protein